MNSDSASLGSNPSPPASLTPSNRCDLRAERETGFASKREQNRNSAGISAAQKSGLRYQTHQRVRADGRVGDPVKRLQDWNEKHSGSAQKAVSETKPDRLHARRTVCGHWSRPYRIAPPLTSIFKYIQPIAKAFPRNFKLFKYFYVAVFFHAFFAGITCKAEEKRLPLIENINVIYPDPIQFVFCCDIFVDEAKAIDIPTGDNGVTSFYSKSRPPFFKSVRRGFSKQNMERNYRNLTSSDIFYKKTSGFLIGHPFGGRYDTWSKQPTFALLEQLGGLRRGLSGLFGEVGGSAGSYKRGEPDPYANAPGYESRPRPESGIRRSIRSLPLGAKIGATIVLTLLAWLICTWSLVRLLQDPSQFVWRIGWGIIGVGVLGSSFVIWG